MKGKWFIFEDQEHEEGKKDDDSSSFMVTIYYQRLWWCSKSQFSFDSIIQLMKCCPPFGKWIEHSLGWDHFFLHLLPISIMKLIIIIHVQLQKQSGVERIMVRLREKGGKWWWRWWRMMNKWEVERWKILRHDDDDYQQKSVTYFSLIKINHRGLVFMLIKLLKI